MKVELQFYIPFLAPHFKFMNLIGMFKAPLFTITTWFLNREEEKLEKILREFKLNAPNIKHVRILVIGEVGAGKSSFINSVNSVFQKRITNEALVNKTSDSKTFTKLVSMNIFMSLKV